MSTTQSMAMKKLIQSLLAATLLCSPVSAWASTNETALVSEAQVENLPKMRWGNRDPEGNWKKAALVALNQHGQSLTDTIPRDIAAWCPYYEKADEATRQAFWIGFMSALAKHESTYKANAVGGGGQWFGLLQISPATARGYDCNAGTGEALKDGGANLSCAIRIMSVTVPRDGVITAKDGRWRGVAADWGPLRSEAKRQDMAAWLNEQPYCKASISPEPEPEPKAKWWISKSSDR